MLLLNNIVICLKLLAINATKATDMRKTPFQLPMVTIVKQQKINKL
jgi:hypothetical protein